MLIIMPPWRNASSIEKIGVEIRHLQRTDCEKQKSSSPESTQKVVPCINVIQISSENMAGVVPDDARGLYAGSL